MRFPMPNSDLEYQILDHKKSFSDPDWNEFANIAAYDFSILCKTFNSAIRQKNDETVFYYISSYNKLLTLMSIGKNEKERLLSLVAEIYLFLSVNIDDRKMTVQSQLLKIKKKYDGICSGVWKYYCFKQDNLLGRIFTILNKYNYNVMRCSLDYVTKTVDKNPNIMNYIDECGEFLIHLAYALYRMGQKYNIDMGDKLSDLKYVLSAEEELKKQIDNRYGTKCTQEEILSDIKQLRMEAGALLDKCDIFLNEEALFFDIYKTIFVIISDKDEIPEEIRKQALSFKNVEEDNRDFLEILCIPDIEIGIQLEKILLSCRNVENIKIILCNMENNYEGIICSKTSNKGRNFNKFILDILEKEEKRTYTGKEFIVCYKSEIDTIVMNNYSLVEQKDQDTINNYKIKRYYINEKIQDIRPVVYIDNVGTMTMDINEIKGKYVKIIEADNYYDNSQIVNSDIDNVTNALKELMTHVDSRQAEIIQNTITAIENKEESKIKIGLEKIKNMGGNILESVASTAITAYMISYGILPPV